MGYGNQRRLFSGNLLGMFLIFVDLSDCLIALKRNLWQLYYSCGLFYAIYRLTDFLSNALAGKTQRKLSGSAALLEPYALLFYVCDLPKLL